MFEPGRIATEAVLEEARLLGGPLDAAFLEGLHASFERSAKAALDAQAFSERSRRARGLVRRLVPARARPALRRLVVGVESGLRRRR